MIGSLPKPAYVTEFYQTFPSFALNCGFYPSVTDRLMAKAYGRTAPDPYVPLVGLEHKPDKATLPPFLKKPRSETSRRMQEDWERLQKILEKKRGPMPDTHAERLAAVNAILDAAHPSKAAGHPAAAAMMIDEVRTTAAQWNYELWESLAPRASRAWFTLMQTETDDTAYAFFLSRALAAPLNIGTTLTEEILDNSIAYFLRQGDALDAARASVEKAHNRFEMTSADWLTIRKDLLIASAYFGTLDHASAKRTAEFADMASKEASAATKGGKG